MTAAVQTIRLTFAKATLGTPVTHAALTVVPLHATGAKTPDWLTLADAGETVTVTEVTEAGNVPTLSVKNASDRPLLLLDGEELIGAKQNRILNTTVLIAARSTVQIPVSCVEQGRWFYRGRRSTVSDFSLYASVRRMKSARVTASLRERGRHDSDQGEVWRERATKADFLMHEVYECYALEVAAAREALAPQPGQTGAIVYVAGAWAGLELLGASSLFARAWPRMVSGYIADAIGQTVVHEPRPGHSEVLKLVTAAPLEEAPAVGLGVEYRWTGAQSLGAALVVDDVVAHLVTFPAM